MTATQMPKMTHGAATIRSLPVISPALCCVASGVSLYAVPVQPPSVPAR